MKNVICFKCREEFEPTPEGKCGGCERPEFFADFIGTVNDIQQFDSIGSRFGHVEEEPEMSKVSGGSDE